MRFQRWQTVLLEWDSNLANSCSVIEKKTNFLKCIFFLEFFTFFQLHFASGSEKSILTQVIHTR